MEGTVEMPYCMVLVFCGCVLDGACWRWLLRMDCAIYTEEENGKATQGKRFCPRGPMELS